MKYKDKAFPFTSPQLRSLRILAQLVKSFAMAKQYGNSSKALSFLLPLLKKTDDLEIFQWLVNFDIEKITSERIFEYLNRLFGPEKAMFYHVLLKIQSSPKEALGIIEAVIEK